MSIAPVEEAVDLSELDFAHVPPCEVWWINALLRIHGKEDAPPADWLIVFATPSVCCGHEVTPSQVYACDRCWGIYSTFPVECVYCHRIFTDRTWLASVHPVRKDGHG